MCKHENLWRGVFKAKCKDCGKILVRKSLRKPTKDEQ